MTHKSQHWLLLAWLLFGCISLFLSFNIHSRAKRWDYHSQIYADKAGYYAYLPATFVWSWQADAVPDSLQEKLGHGIVLRPDGKIFTKYPIGVAVLEVPFFALGQLLVGLGGKEADGFQLVNFKMVDVAAWFYMMWAMWLLFHFLSAYWQRNKVLFILAAFFLGTNLFYYYSVESGMAHIYGFFAVAALLRLLQKVFDQGNLSLANALLLGLVVALLFLIRFTNVLLLPMAVLLLAPSWREFRSIFLQPRILLPLLAAVPLLAVQASYYYYLEGSFWINSYAGEGFDLGNPQLLKFWFSPHNGLFPYSPIALIALMGLPMLWKSEAFKALSIFLGFLLLTYLFSSWSSWHFGCGFGMRSMLEFMPFLMIPFGKLLEKIGNLNRPYSMAIMAIFVLLMIINAKNAYRYSLCYAGQGDWDWNFWIGLIQKI